MLPRRSARTARWVAALVGILGVATELFATPRLAGLDAAAGYALVGFGLACWTRDRGGFGPLLLATGFLWFAGDWFTAAAYLHRGPLVQVLVTYPTARLWPSRRSERVAVLAAYVYAVLYPLADDATVSLVVAAIVVVTAAARLARAHGPDVPMRRTALGAACLFGAALALASIASLADWTGGETVLAFYDLSVLTVAAVRGWGILARRQEAAVVGLVVDLGEPSTRGVLRNRLAATIGDPTLRVGFWVPVLERYVDELGRPIDIAHTEGRELMAIDDGGVQVAILIHDPGALDDPQLRSDVASATRLAVVNARLQAEIAERVYNDAQRSAPAVPANHSAAAAASSARHPHREASAPAAAATSAKPAARSSVAGPSPVPDATATISAATPPRPSTAAITGPGRRTAPSSHHAVRRLSSSTAGTACTALSIRRESAPLSELGPASRAAVSGCGGGLNWGPCQGRRRVVVVGGLALRSVDARPYLGPRPGQGR